MLEVILFTNYQFDSQDKAFALFEFLNKVGGVFTPVSFDSKEPVRKVYIPDNLSEPIRLLSGYPEHLCGEIFLKGAKHKYLAWIKWSKSRISRWHIYIDNNFCNKESRVEIVIQFITKLCEKFPPIYGGLAPKDDWDAKHVLIEHYPDGGESHEKVGLSLERCLPGIYWVTIFGKPLVKHFGRRNLKSLPAYRIIDISDSGLIMMLRALPFIPEQAERLHQDKEIIKILGSQYFFEIDTPEKVCQPYCTSKTQDN